MTLVQIKEYLDRIHWQQVFVLSVTVICMTGAPVLFFIMVSPEVLNILVGLPWLTMFGPGLTALVGALGVLRGFFGPSLIRPKGGETTQTSTTTIVREEAKVERDDTHEVS